VRKQKTISEIKVGCLSGCRSLFKADITSVIPTIKLKGPSKTIKDSYEFGLRAASNDATPIHPMTTEAIRSQ